MVERIPGLSVLGGARDSIPGVTQPVQQGDKFQFGSLSVSVLDTPCHTSGHVMYQVTSSEEEDPPALFTGDTVFLAGCGRFFEGDATQFHSVVEKLQPLPAETLIFCGHEYSVKNLEFALSVDEENPTLKDKYQWAVERREQALPTIPSTLGEEREYNPFLRYSEPALLKATGQEDPVESLAILRKMKDRF